MEKQGETFACGKTACQTGAQPPNLPSRFRPRLLYDGSGFPCPRRPSIRPTPYLMPRFAPDVSPLATFCSPCCSCFCDSPRHPASRQRPSQPQPKRAKAARSPGCADVRHTVRWRSGFCCDGYRNVVLFATLGVTAGITWHIDHAVGCVAQQRFCSVMFYGAIACASVSCRLNVVSLCIKPVAVCRGEKILAIAGSVLPNFRNQKPRTNGWTRTETSPASKTAGGSYRQLTRKAVEHADGLASSLRLFYPRSYGFCFTGFLVCSFMMAAYSFDAPT